MWNDSCGWARQRLPLLAGGELAGSDRRKTERHLISCASCRTHLVSLNASLNVLHAVAAEPLALTQQNAPSLWPAVARQIRESRRPAPPFWPSIELRPFPLAWTATGLAAAALLAGGLLTSAYHLYHRRSNAPLANAAPRDLQIPSVADLKPRDAEVDAEVAEGPTARPETEIAIPVPTASATHSASPRGSMIKTSGNGGINASMDATN